MIGCYISQCPEASVFLLILNDSEVVPSLDKESSLDFGEFLILLVCTPRGPLRSVSSMFSQWFSPYMEFLYPHFSPGIYYGFTQVASAASSTVL